MTGNQVSAISTFEDRPIEISMDEGVARGEFFAMGSPCEILLDTADLAFADKLVREAAREAWRIEQKYSRYRDDGIVPRINRCEAKAVKLDKETASLVDFAFKCYKLSEGMFDITSGVLRRAWTFDGSDNVPSAEEVSAILPFVGLDRVFWRKNKIALKPGMEIDLGGIGKEYAVDRVLDILAGDSGLPVLVNFGGDIAASAPRINSAGEPEPWRVGIEASNEQDKALSTFPLYQGAIATSGDSRRYLLKDGIRYGHILNPKTGWPVEGAPHAITVNAGTCTEAGVLSTLAMLKGSGAEEFLRNEGVQFWCQR